MKSILLSLFATIWACYGFAQNAPVTGTVQDVSTGELLVGASISEKGTVNGTIAGVDGKFALVLTGQKAILVVEYIGFEPLELEVGAGEEISITMAPKDLVGDVVITALGLARDKKALGYSVQEIDGEAITLARETNLLNGLSGRLAGVQITNGASGVGSSSHIVIRGQTSLSGTNQALFVVDGVPISNELITNLTDNTAAGFQEIDYGNGAGELSADDIESISVLKGPAATALYGSRAANGVVVINTKAGKGTQGVGVSFNSSLTFETPLVQRQYQNAYGQGTGGLFEFEDGLNGGVNDGEIVSFGPLMDGRLIPQFDGPSTDVNGNPVRGADVIARNGNPITPTPWTANPDNVKNFWETGITAINNISFSGDDGKGNYRLSYTNLENKGIVPGTDLQRNSIALTGGYQLTKRLKARTFINFVRSESENRPGIGYGSENPMYTFTWMGRQVDVDNLKDYWQAGQEGIAQYNYNYAWMDNPYFTLMENRNSFQKNRILGNLQLQYQLTDHLDIRLRSGMDTYNDQRASQRGFSSQRWRNGAYREDNVQFSEINTDLLLSYSRKVTSDLDLTVSAGGNRMMQESRYLALTAGELSVPGIYNFQNTRIPLVNYQYLQQKRINSVYGFTQLGWKNKLYADLTLRNDWSSTLPVDNNSYAYYSASVSGILTEWFSLPEAITFAKIRLSGASVGSDTDPYNLNTTFAFNTPYASNPTVTGSPTLLNANLRPERLNSIEAGFDIRLFQSRVGLDVSVYSNTGKDQIIELPTSTASGFSSRVVNGGTIRSEGLEVLLNLRPIVKEKFTWNSWVNFTRNVSRVVELPEGVDQYTIGFARVYDRSDRAVYFIAEEGGIMGNMYGTGLLEVDGQHVYDANGNPVKDPNLRLLGNFNPDFIMGWGNDFTLGRVNFGFLLDWRHGGTIVSRTKAIASTSGVLASTLEGRENGVVGDGVVNVGTTAEPNYVPNTTAIPAQDYYNQFFDRDNEANHLYDASFLKLRQIQVGYQLPQEVASRIKMQSIRISFIARNLFLITENPHFDPETTTMQGRNFAFGVEDMAYPSARSYGLNLQISL